MTGEDLSLKPSTTEQTKFEYSSLGKIFNKGLDKNKDKKEGLLKRLKNIEDKSKELPNALSEAIKARKNDNCESNFYHSSTWNFCKFYRDLKMEMASLDSKRGELIDF